MISGPRRVADVAAALLTTMLLTSCSHRPPDDEVRLATVDSRVSAAGLEEDPAVAARLEEMRAALAQEHSPLFDEFQVRVDNSNDGDHDVEVTARLPVPNPFEFQAERDVRRRATEISEARIDETILERRAEACFRNVEGADGRQRADLFEAYEAEQLDLLEWNRRWRESGAVNEQAATRFEIERRVTLAKRIPRPTLPSPSTEEGPGLPPVGAPQTRLVRKPEHIRKIVRRAHPAVAVQTAESERYAALSKRASTRDIPWLDFVDVAYDTRQGQSDELSGQIAVRIPLGSTGRSRGRYFTALRESKRRDGERVTLDYARRARIALEEIDHFESNTTRWRLLLDLAREATAAAKRWKQDRLGSPSQVASLLDDAHEARIAVLSARTRAGMAACSLFSSSGVGVEDWRREPVPEPPATATFENGLLRGRPEGSDARRDPSAGRRYAGEQADPDR